MSSIPTIWYEFCLLYDRCYRFEQVSDKWGDGGERNNYKNYVPDE